MNAIVLICGLLSVYFGYRLFCTISRRPLTAVSGAVLAVFGMVMLVGEAKAFAVRSAHPTPGMHRTTNWHNGSAPVYRVRPHRQNIA